MYNHAPKDYECPFCLLVNGGEDEHNKQKDIVYKDNYALAFVAPKWWVNNPGHVIVISCDHHENIYDIPDKVLGEVYKTVKKVSLAIKEAYGADAISTRQHNEPSGNQDVWHFHVHVFPRYKDDKLYLNHDKKYWVTPEAKDEYVKKLKSYFKRLS